MAVLSKPVGYPHHCAHRPKQLWEVVPAQDVALDTWPLSTADLACSFQRWVDTGALGAPTTTSKSILYEFFAAADPNFNCDKVFCGRFRREFCIRGFFWGVR